LFSPSQIRAARALVGWSQTDVATAAGLSVPTVKRAEADGGIRVSEDAVQAIANALKKAGVEFIAENGGGPGVRLRKKGAGGSRA
jgi:transcriptional regulator with XRE-family HTH domain